MSVSGLIEYNLEKSKTVFANLLRFLFMETIALFSSSLKIFSSEKGSYVFILRATEYVSINQKNAYLFYCTLL